MKLIADLHTHLAGQEPLEVLLENISKHARARGLACVALTDHLPKTSNVYAAWERECQTRIAAWKPDVDFLCGTEADIGGLDGSLKAPKALFAASKLTLAALHPYCVKPGSRREHTQAFEIALLDPLTDVLAHPMDAPYPFDEEYITALAARTGKALELNALSQRLDPACATAQRRLALLAKKHGALLTVSSDAQRPQQVGDFSGIDRWLDELEIPSALVVNASEENLCAFLQRRAREKGLEGDSA